MSGEDDHDPAPGAYCCLNPSCTHDRDQVFNGGGGQDAGNEGAVALWPGRSLARVLAGVVLRPTLPRQLEGPDLLA